MNNALKMVVSCNDVRENRKTKESGTTMHLNQIQRFSVQRNYNYETLCERLRESAFLLKGMKISIKDEKMIRRCISL